MITLSQLYLGGRHEEIWMALLALGDHVRRDSLYADALAVVDETMQRVRHNIEILIDRLNRLHYPFGRYPDGTPLEDYLGPFIPPAPRIRDDIALIEARIGPLPLALRRFWEIVGEVNLIGTHPAWPKYIDPLVVYSPSYVLEAYAEWQELCEEEGHDAGGPFAVLLAPDYLLKDHISGGGPYRMLVPNPSVDGILIGEYHQTTLVNYLRLCFRAGGFPGILRTTGPVAEIFQGLAKDLLPI
jgi:hypothetical protein